MSEPDHSEPSGRSVAAALHRPICPEGQAAKAIAETVAERETVAESMGEPSASEATYCAVRARPFVLAATIIASAMAFIDGSVVHIALPTIQAELGASFTEMQWVVNAYALMLGALILVGGGMGDRFGRRRVFETGIILFALSSLLCALAPSAWSLIAARALQGIGAALMVPQSLAILAASFPPEIRGRAIGTWAGASAITTSLGPPLGGVLINLLDWRAVFWINLPLAALALVLSRRFVPESRDTATAEPLDWTGAALAVLAFGALAYGLGALSEAGGGLGGSVEAGAILLAGVVLTLGFLWFEARKERRGQAPLVRLSLFRSGAFAGANIMTVFIYGALSAVLFLLPYDLIERRGLSAAEAGLTMLPLGLVIGLGSRRAGEWADRVGVRMPLALGSSLVALGTLGLAAGLGSYPTAVLLPLILLSAGMALVVAPLTTAVMNAVPTAQSGTASGVNNAASRLAGLFAVAAAGALASAVFTGALEPSVTAQAGSEHVRGAVLTLVAESATPTATDPPRFGILPPEDAIARPAWEEAFQSAFRAAMALAALWALLAALTAMIAFPRHKAASAT